MSVELKPCPVCGEKLEAWGVNYRHNIDSKCYLAYMVRVTPTDVEAWNRQAASAAPADGSLAFDYANKLIRERMGMSAPAEGREAVDKFTAARNALCEAGFTQQDAYLLSPGASKLSDESHEIIHVDTLRKIVDAALATAPTMSEAVRDVLTAVVERTIEVIARQLELIEDRAKGDFLDKRPVVQSLLAHKGRLQRALAKIERIDRANAEGEKS